LLRAGVELTPHVAQNAYGKRKSGIDGRTTRHEGYEKSQYCRRGIERFFGWLKASVDGKETRFRDFEGWNG
jgi:hypothetical protein